MTTASRQASPAARDAVIVEAVRSPVGKRNGALADIHPVDLSAQVLRELVTRAEIDAAAVEDVIWGCVTQAGEQSANVGRYSVLAAGWPEEIPGTTVDRQCGSSQQAVHFAAAAVASGQHDVLVAGGVESMSRVPMGWARLNGPGEPYGTETVKRYGTADFNQGRGAEMLAERGGFTRADLDAYGLESHRRVAAAIDAGHFEREIAAITVEADGGSTEVRADEGVRRGGSLESMARLPTPFREDGVVTAGNSSQISDGSAALLITTSEVAARLGLRPRARLIGFAVTGVDPVTMLYGPIPATEKALARTGLAAGDIGTFEINEAFASVNLAWLDALGVPPERVNPDGGAIALGHPLGASGARLMTTMLCRMEREGIRYGLQAMCEGGGTANATVLELLEG